MIEAVNLQQLLNRSHENKLAHAFLLETNNVNNCLKDIEINSEEENGEQTV